MKAKNKILLSLLMIAGLPSIILLGQDKKLWLTGGQNLNNTRSADFETKISVSNAASLAIRWQFNTGGDVSATPVLDDAALYFPDWAGNLYKLNSATGAVIWSHPIGYYTGIAGDLARASPALAGNKLIIGTQLSFSAPATLDGAHILAINKITGELIWKTKVEDFFGAIITQSAIVYNNRVYVGVASQEEGLAADPTYPCCSFRGSLVCLDLQTGAILWKTYMAPANKGFSGNAIWGGTPVIDPKRNSVYVTTGNNYTVPQAVLDCVAAGGTPQQVRDCISGADGSVQNYFDAFVSLDLTTGAVKWVTSVIPFDAWTVACFFDGPNCPENAGPDYDFGQGAALYTVGKTELLGSGQKSGIYWALDPATGAIVWSTQVGPGSALGGLQWGSAVDGKRVYTAVSNFFYIPFQLTTGPSAGRLVNGGFWAALDAATGERIWEYAGTNPPAVGPANAIAFNTGMVTVANGVVFAGAMDAPGTMYAFDGATGAKLWSYESGGTVNSGPAVVNGVAYWGSGYSNLGLGTANHKLFAFEPAKNAVTQLSAESLKAEELATGWASVAPNPFKNTRIDLMVSDQKGKKISWSLINTQGSAMIKGKFDALSNKHKQSLELGTVAAGSYVIRVESGNRSAILKVVKLE